MSSPFPFRIGYVFDRVCHSGSLLLLLLLLKWYLSFSASGVHCFNRRLGYLTEEGRREAEEVVEASYTLFDMNTHLNFSLPFYKYLSTPKWKKVFAAEDVLYR